MYDQVLTFLRTALRTTFAPALVVALGAWLSGPRSVAVRLRGLFRREPVPAEAPTAVAAFVARYRVALLVVVVGLGLVFLVAFEHPRPLAVLVVALVVLVLLAVIELLARRHRPATAP